MCEVCVRLFMHSYLIIWYSICSALHLCTMCTKHTNSMQSFFINLFNFMRFCGINTLALFIILYYYLVYCTVLVLNLICQYLFPFLLCHAVHTCLIWTLKKKWHWEARKDRATSLLGFKRCRGFRIEHTHTCSPARSILQLLISGCFVPPMKLQLTHIFTSMVVIFQQLLRVLSYKKVISECPSADTSLSVSWGFPDKVS